MKASFSFGTGLAIARWTARGLGILLLLIVAAFTIGEGLPPFASLSRTEFLLFAALGAMLAGIVLAWRWEGLGAGLILGGYALFSAINRSLPLGLIFSAFPAVGGLHLLCRLSALHGPRTGKGGAE